MHDDDTRSSERNWMPWENTAIVDDPTTDDATTTSTTTAAAPRRFAPTWQQGAALAGAGLIAFLGVSQILGAHPRVTVRAPASTKKVDANPVNLRHTAGTKDFPADAVTTCFEGSGQAPNPNASRVRAAKDSATSCAFLEDSHARVLAHIASAEESTTAGESTKFTVPAVSLTTKQEYELTCERAAHLTYCIGGNHAAMYIKDTFPN